MNPITQETPAVRGTYLDDKAIKQGSDDRNN